MQTTDIISLMDRGELWRFYKSKEWLKLKTHVLQDFHYECQICKQKGIITRYDTGTDGKRRLLSTVHHVNEVRKHPELALTRYYYDREGNRHDNLIPICKQCHNQIHDRNFKNKQKGFTNQERW